RLVRASAVDAIVHTDIPQFPEPGRAARQLHDVTVMGTLQLLAAAGDLPTLRTLVVRGSASIYGSEPAAPAFFTEDMAGPATGRGQRRGRGDDLAQRRDPADGAPVGPDPAPAVRHRRRRRAAHRPAAAQRGHGALPALRAWRGDRADDGRARIHAALRHARRD